MENSGENVLALISYGSLTSNLVCTSTVLENFFLKLESCDTRQLLTACLLQTRGIDACVSGIGQKLLSKAI